MDNSMGGTATLLEDRFVRSVIGPLLLLLIVAMVFPAIVACYVLVDTQMLTSKESATATSLIGVLIRWHGLPKEAAGQIIGSIPILLTVMCFQHERDRGLTWLGRMVFIIVVIGTLVSAIPVALLQSGNASQASNLLSAQAGLTALVDGSSNALRLMLHYLFLVLGLNMSGAPANRAGGSQS